MAPLLHFPVGSRQDLWAVLAQSGWGRYGLKLTTSANAENTILGAGTPAAAVLALADTITCTSGLLLQPFFPEIVEEGEWSLIFAADQLVRTLLKRLRAGDFRPQPDQGHLRYRVGDAS